MQIYPTVMVGQSDTLSKREEPIVVRLQAHYPTFELCNYPYTLFRNFTLTLFRVDPPGYPYNVMQIYPTVTASQSYTLSKREESIVVRLQAHYPMFELCNSPYTLFQNVTLTLFRADPPGYPYNVMQIYPTVMTGQSYTPSKREEPIVVRLPAHYPTFDLCESFHIHVPYDDPY
jgi:beta-galactosidase GanA